MIGVRFNRAMHPWGPRDTALLPDDAARSLIAEGAADPYQFPESPHSSEALPENQEPLSQSLHPAQPSRPRRQNYLTK